MTAVWKIAAITLGAAAAVPALAQDAGALYVRSMAATCAQCHGTDGRPVGGSPLAALAGMPREQLVTQLKAFKDGSRPGTIMPQLAKGYSDAQIEQLATFFASRK
jgi:cytochrome c553